VPAGARIIKTSVDVTTAWNVTETVAIGDAALTNRLMVDTANDPEFVSIYSTDNDYVYAAITTINATVTSANGPAAGAATVIVQYIQP